jgi:hypothetical protein
MFKGDGVIVRATTTGAITVTETTPAMPVDGSVAVTLADPKLTPVVSPAPTVALETLAMAAAEDVHVTELVMLRIEPSV